MNRFLATLLLPPLLVLAAACSGDGATQGGTPTDEPGTTAQAEATPTPPLVARPTLQSLTRTPAPTLESDATPTPTRDTSREDSPSATPVPDLAFYFGGDVSVFERTLIITAIEVARDLLETDAGVRPPVSVFASSSLEAVASDFRDHAREQNWRADALGSRLRQGVAEASYRGVVVNTGSPNWEALSDAELMRAIAHEYVHVAQLENTGLDVADSTLARPSGSVPPAGPFWLLEGSAEVVSYLVAEELDLANYTATIADLGISVRGQEVPLGDMESYLGYISHGEDGVAWSILATDYLLRNRSLESLFDFWADIGEGVRWEDAFVRRFGLPPRFYYEAFEEYYRSTFGT